MTSSAFLTRVGVACLVATTVVYVPSVCWAAKAGAADGVVVAGKDSKDDGLDADTLPSNKVAKAEAPRRAGLRIENVKVTPRDAKTATITFDVSWPCSWRYGTLHDAAWVFFKVRADAKSEWKHVRLVADPPSPRPQESRDSGAACKVLNPTGYTQEKGGTDLEFVVPDGDDGFTGVFLRRAATGSGRLEAKGVTVLCEAQSLNTENRTLNTLFRGFGIEMVYIPEGPFYVGLGSDEPFPGGGYGFGGKEQNWLYRYSRSDGRDLPGTFAYSRTGYVPAWIIGDPDVRIPAYLVNSAGAIPTGCQPGSLWAVAIKPENKGEIPAAFPNGYAAFYCMKYPWITEGQYADFLNTLTAAQAKPHYWIEGHGVAIGGGPAVKRLGKKPDYTYAATNPDEKCPWVSWKDATAYGAWAGLRPMTELEFEKILRGPEFAAPNDASPSYWGVNGMQISMIFERTISIGDAVGRAFRGSHGRGTLEPPADWPATHLEGVILRGDAVPSVWSPNGFIPTHLLIAGRTFTLYANQDQCNDPYPAWRGARSAPAPAGTKVEGKMPADTAMSPFTRPEPQLCQLPRLKQDMKADGILDEWDKPALVLDQPTMIQMSHMRFPSLDNPEAWRGPEDMSVKVYLARDSHALCVAAEVKDDVLCSTNVVDDPWDGDCMNFGLIDSDANQTDLWLASGTNGVAFNPLIDKYGRLEQAAQRAVVRDEDAKVTRYELRLPMDALRLKKDTECCFYFRFFDNDGKTARYRFDLAPLVLEPFKAKLFWKFVVE